MKEFPTRNGSQKSIGQSLWGRVGIYDLFKGHELYEYNPNDDCGCREHCCHHSCKLSMLRDAGRVEVADQLERNAKAKDYAGNWGKLAYDPQTDGRHPAKRKLLADIIREMRRGTVGYADAVRVGAWAGCQLK